MAEFPKLPIVTPPPPRNEFPELPLLAPDPPRMTLREKYGSLYYLGIAGLVVSLLLVGSFGYGLWATRDYWAGIYALNSLSRPEPERIKAAWALSRHPAANDRFRFDSALRKDLPRLARYILAESLTSEAIRADPKGFALMVAKSEGWPSWLRLLMARPMAYGVGEGYRIAWEPLDLLRENPDPAIALWATYTRAVMAPGDAPSSKALEQAAGEDGPFRPLAHLLDQAAKSEGDARARKLDEATAWLRTNHPEARAIWDGWVEQGGHLIEVGAGKIEAR